MIKPAGEVLRSLFIELTEVVVPEGRIGVWNAISPEYGREFNKITFDGIHVANEVLV